LRNIKIEKYLLRERRKNMKRLILIVSILFLICIFTLTTTTIQAQPYPNRTIQLVIPATPGAAIDTTGRLVADELGKILGTQMITVNKPGASMTLGTDMVVRSKKDGYTLLYANTTAIIYSRVASPEIVPYDPVKDLEPLGMHLWIPSVVAVREDSPWKTFSEFITYAKQNPQKIRISTHSEASIDRFNVEICQSLTGAQFSYIPFKGAPEAMTALLGGHVEATANALSLALPHFSAGKMRILLTSRKYPEFPNIPTLTELGYKQELNAGWFALYAPAGVPEEVKKVLIPAFQRTVRNPEMKSKIGKMGFIVDYKSPAELNKIMIEDYETSVAIAIKIGLRKQ
jgi:tripartite-type tricarboxylate transporter receptor subunit TctC